MCFHNNGTNTPLHLLESLHFNMEQMNFFNCTKLFISTLHHYHSCDMTPDSSVATVNAPYHTVFVLAPLKGFTDKLRMENIQCNSYQNLSLQNLNYDRVGKHSIKLIPSNYYVSFNPYVTWPLRLLNNSHVV